MSATIFPSLTTILVGVVITHHHPPIIPPPPQPTITLTKKNHNALKKSRKYDFVKLSRVIASRRGGNYGFSTRYTFFCDIITKPPC
ncbi:hypothetical protein Hanom_Chr02g00112711 [Helianthus anomalus]